MRAVFPDCPPFMKTLYDQGLDQIVPGLEVHVGSPAQDEALRLLEGVAAMVVDHTTLDAAFLDACAALETIVFLGTGASSFIDLEAAARRGITVRTISGYGDQSVAEHALALAFAAARGIAAMDRATRGGSFEPRTGIELAGKTLGVVGTGGIGRAMIRLGAGIGMRVLAWNRSGVPAGLPAEEVSLPHLLRAADVLSLHLGLSDETRGFLGAERLGLLKPSAILVNTARGALIDEAALIQALGEGRIAHAALDVFADEPLPPGHSFLGLQNVTLTPHAAFATTEATERLLRTGLEMLREEMTRAPKGE